MQIDWKRKLTSRKFWAMLAGLIVGIIVYIQSPEKSPESIGSLVIIAGSLVSYIFGEAIADLGRNGGKNDGPAEDHPVD